MSAGVDSETELHMTRTKCIMELRALIFRHPTDEQLRHVDIYFLATNIIWSLSTLN